MPLRNQFIIGTATSVGKNTIVCSLLSAARRKGVNAVPFKPFAIDVAGQAELEPQHEWTPSITLQSLAAGRTASKEMNPVRLLYRGGSGSFASNLPSEDSIDFSDIKQAKSAVRLRVEQSLALLKPYDVVICEGSGSMVDALSTDVFNTAVVDILDPEIIVVANAQNGGAYAQVVGTLALMDEAAVQRVRLIVINEMNNSICRPIFHEFREIVQARFGVGAVEIIPTFASIEHDESSHAVEAIADYVNNIDFIADRMKVCAPSLFTFLPP